ncbi:MAG: hypothetical protein JW712_14150 [Dehalococcoidales bacterium]|nr:hypothetical protein [Dehalococcoidales bacterium]
MIDKTLTERLLLNGITSRTVSIHHVPEIREAVGSLISSGAVDRELSRNWHFHLENKVRPPNAETILITAIPQPVKRLRFSWKEKVYTGDIAPNYFYEEDENRVEEIIKDTLEPDGYTAGRARLPLKTLAVRSGMAKYGRNNISYIAGLGSFYRLLAFYTDCPLTTDNWQQPEMMPECENCSLCRDACTMGSIDKERFLIHAENCLGAKADQNPDYPWWVRYQPGYPQAFIGCMLCQAVCPVNRPFLETVNEETEFSESETGMILNTAPLESLPEETLRKLGNPPTGLYRYFHVNLRALIEKQYMRRE